MAQGRHYDYPKTLVERIKQKYPDHDALHGALDEGDDRARLLLSDMTPDDHTGTKAELTRELFAFADGEKTRVAQMGM